MRNIKILSEYLQGYQGDSHATELQNQLPLFKTTFLFERGTNLINRQCSIPNYSRVRSSMHTAAYIH